MSSNSSTSTISAAPNKGSHRSQYSLVLGLTSVNGTFEKKSLVIPFYPDVLRLGRQTSSKTQPAPDNGFFDSRVLSRVHAELWADYDTGRVWIKDSKSSNGTYVNSLRLGDEKSEREMHELRKNDVFELGIDIANDEGTSFVHRKISAKVERISFMSLQAVSAQPPPLQQLQLHPGQMNKSQSDQQYLQGGYSNSSPGPSNANGTVNRNSRNLANGPQRSTRSITESLDMALFGDMDASLEELSLSHSRSSMSGLFMNSGVTSSATMELIVKKLVAEIHAAKVESAKIHSVGKLLEEISRNQQESRILGEKLPALDESKHQIASLSTQLEAAKQEINEKNRHIYELESALAKSLADVEPRPNSPEAINRHGDPVSPGPSQTEPVEEEEDDEDEEEQDKEQGRERERERTKKRKSVDRGLVGMPPTALELHRKEDTEKKLLAIQSELEETKIQLQMFKNRTKTAESIAIQQSKQITELTLGSSSGSGSGGSSASSSGPMSALSKTSTVGDNSSTGTEHEDDDHGRPNTMTGPAAGTGTTAITGTTTSTTTTTTTRSKLTPASEGIIMLLPLAWAIGVVLLGAGLVAIINAIGSEK